MKYAFVEGSWIILIQISSPAYEYVKEIAWQEYWSSRMELMSLRKPENFVLMELYKVFIKCEKSMSKYTNSPRSAARLHFRFFSMHGLIYWTIL